MFAMTKASSIHNYSRIVAVSLSLIHHIVAQEDEGYEESTKEAQSGSNMELYKMLFISFMGACVTLIFFFIIKFIIECRNRNRPIEDVGPFGTSRFIDISELTQPQRRAVLEFIFTDDKYFKKIQNKVNILHLSFLFFASFILVLITKYEQFLCNHEGSFNSRRCRKQNVCYK